mmetsp:Transcript_6180/g.9704  ORF Transcript_6180/g.9704 Transcript_6180/m.9704 type:complete len:91 (+) Transcript_6180:1023-1295(+)
MGDSSRFWAFLDFRSGVIGGVFDSLVVLEDIFIPLDFLPLPRGEGSDRVEVEPADEFVGVDAADTVVDPSGEEEASAPDCNASKFCSATF